MNEKVLLIDGNGLLFIKKTTDLDLRINDILKNSGISNYRIFLKEELNNKKEDTDVRDTLINKYNAEVYFNPKSEIIVLYNCNKEKYVVASLSSELFDELDGIHFDYYYKRNKYIKC